MYTFSGTGPVVTTGATVGTGATLAFTGFPALGLVLVGLGAIVLGFVLLRVSLMARATRAKRRP